MPRCLRVICKVAAAATSLVSASAAFGTEEPQLSVELCDAGLFGNSHQGTADSVEDACLLQQRLGAREAASARGPVALWRGFVRDPGRHDSRRVLWFHLHKQGGTTMCYFAETVGEVISSNLNCNIAPDTVSEANTSLQLGCAERVKSKFSFSAIERYLTPLDLDCPEALYGTLLREPVAAARSHMHFHRFSEEEKVHILGLLASPEGKVVPTPTSAGLLKSDWWRDQVPAWDTFYHVDNFATRTFSGNYFAAPRGLTRGDLEKAKAALAKMHVVMTLEGFYDQIPQLQYIFGWPLRSEVPGKPRFNIADGGEHYFTAEEEAFVKSVNSLDIELYAFAKKLEENKTSAAKKELDGITKLALAAKAAKEAAVAPPAR